MTRKMIKGLHHCCILCRNLEDSIIYYRDVIGFKLLYQTSEYEGSHDQAKTAFMKLDTFILMLTEPVAWSQDAYKWARGDMNHICLAVGDLVATKKRLENDFQIEWEGEMEESPEYKALFWHGPGGERTEMFEFLDDSPFPKVHNETGQPSFLGLGHISFFSGNLDESAEFYCKVLGFEIVHTLEEIDPNFGSHYRIGFFKLNDIVLEVIQPVVHPVIAERIKYPARMNMNSIAVESLVKLEDAVDYIKSNSNIEWEVDTPVISAGISANENMRWVSFRGINGERWKICSNSEK
jgi:catechol 2,3-dioxygenase-like lactoylglutathione lyase family enzyme